MSKEKHRESGDLPASRTGDSAPDEAAADMMSLLALSPVAVLRWRIAPDFPVESVVGNVEQFGYAKEDLLSGKVVWTDITHPDDLDRLEAEVENCLAKGEDIWTNTYRELPRQGRRHLDEHVSPADAMGCLSCNPRLEPCAPQCGGRTRSDQRVAR
jgi:hypothetical protein